MSYTQMLERMMAHTTQCVVEWGFANTEHTRSVPCLPCDAPAIERAAMDLGADFTCIHYPA